jgi:hypothetical protein
LIQIKTGSRRGSRVVGYNVQVAVDTVNHLIVTHEVTNTGSDRSKVRSTQNLALNVAVSLPSFHAALGGG